MAGVLGQLLRPQKKAMHRSNSKALQLEAAKKILAEIFHARPSVSENMIQSRLEERILAAEEGPLPEGELRPATFCLRE